MFSFTITDESLKFLRTLRAKVKGMLLDVTSGA